MAAPAAMAFAAWRAAPAGRSPQCCCSWPPPCSPCSSFVMWWGAEMRVWIAAFVAGLLFSFGLAVARMIDPARVIGFLDIAGAWDPTLAFVMGAAVIVSGAGFALIRRKLSRPWFADRFHLPMRTEIDAHRQEAGRHLSG